MLAGLSMRETEAGRPERGLLLALAADPERPTRQIILIKRADVPLLTAAVERALYADAERRQFKLGATGLSAAWDADGRHIVTASWDNTARIWDAASGQELRALTGHQDRVLSAAFSSDRRHIVTASSDKTARIWDAASGQEKRALTGHQHRVQSAAFSSDGRHIVAASEDKTARIWGVLPLDVDVWDLARKQNRPDLTETERRDFFLID